MKKILIASLFILISQCSFSQNLNLTLQSQLDFTNNYSSLFGYVDTVGNEYALIGTWQGVSIINVTNPTAPVIVAHVPSAEPTNGNIVWREIKTFNHHAYVTNEQDSALLIIDLSNLPNSNISYHHFFGNDLKKAHTLWIDENGILYIFGFNTYTNLPQEERGAMMFDLNTDPDNPQYIAQYNGSYIHDGFVRGDTLWSSEVYQGKLVIYDVSDKTNFIQLGQVTTPLAFAHNSWPTSDNQFVFTTDEKENSALTAYTVSDLSNITELDQVQATPGSRSVIHNVHLYNNDFAVTSYYTDGIVIFDVSEPDNMINVGNFDSSPLSGFSFNGDWGVYPYLPSKNIIASDMQGGLFVLGVNYQLGCRLKGTITDSVTTALLNGAKAHIINPAKTDSTNYLGIYKTGILNEGLYDMKFSHQGYITKTIQQVAFDSAQTNTLDVQLVPDHEFDLLITVIDSASGLPTAFPKIFMTDNFQYQLSFTGNANGVVAVNNIYGSIYDLYVGAWGQHTKKLSSIAIDSTTADMTLEIEKGYYDDFFFDYGWLASGTASTGDWVRGIPAGTLNDADSANVFFDKQNDFGKKCYLTGNGGGGPGDDDVDDGSAILTSPVFDLSASVDPRIHFYSWFYNGGGNGTPNDSLKIFISNGDSTKLVDFYVVTDLPMSQWIFNDFRIKDFVEPSNNMKMILRTADVSSSGHLLEGGLDLFTVLDTAKFNSMNELQSNDNTLQIFPNPVSEKFKIQNSKFNDGDRIEVTDLSGRKIQSVRINNQTTEIEMDATDLTAGIYFIKVSSNGNFTVKKLIVQ